LVAASWKLGGVAVAAAFIGIAILRFDVIVEVRYVPAKVVSVQELPQLGLHARAVLVDFGKEKRVIRTYSFHPATDIGAKVCVAERSFLLRRFKRYSLAQRAFCPGLKILARPVAGPPALLPGD
jgi:hypothetical protein